MSMKTHLFFSGALLWSLSVWAAETDSCKNNNPYLQQSCELLQQSSQAAQNAQQKEIAQSAAESKQETLQKIATEKPPVPEIPKPEMPTWQKPLDNTVNSATDKPGVPTWQKPLMTSSDKPSKSPDTSSLVVSPLEKESAGNVPAQNVTPLPAPGPTEFSTPKPVTLPGGINVIPTHPERSKGDIYY